MNHGKVSCVHTGVTWYSGGKGPPLLTLSTRWGEWSATHLDRYSLGVSGTFFILFVPFIVIESNRIDQQNAPLLSLIFHYVFYMYMFRIRGLIFRKTVVTSTGMVKCMSTYMVHPCVSYMYDGPSGLKHTCRIYCEKLN